MKLASGVDATTRQPRRGLLLILLAALILSGCAAPRFSSDRPFRFGQDTLAFANELVWEYRFDPVTGRASHSDRQPPPTYSHHCFVVARTAGQFFQFAKFDPSAPVTDEASYRKLIRQVVHANPRKQPSAKIFIPGYTNLFQFSQAQEKLLKEECGGAWQSYFQRGHWRMIGWFSHAHQSRIAEQLIDGLRRNWPAVVHVVNFPRLSINHALVVFDSNDTGLEIRFLVYDPNKPSSPVALIYDKGRREFRFDRNEYYVGGPVDVYQIFHKWNY